MPDQSAVPRVSPPSPASRSQRIPLLFELGDRLDLVLPIDSDRDEVERLEMAFGPLGGMVLASVREVGLPWRLAEIRSLREVDWPLAALGWRAMSTFAQLCEELAALAQAVDEWQRTGRPRQLDCRIGESYLKWVPGRPLGDELLAWRDPRAIQRLGRYPTRAALRRHLGDDDIRNVERVCRVSRRGVALAFGQLSTLLDEDVWRTFIRWKHRLTATSPTRVPIWLPRQSPEGKRGIDSSFGGGFGIIDWPRRGTSPVMIVWPAERDDVATFLQASALAAGLMKFLLDSTLRFGLFSVPVLPILIEKDRPLSPDEIASIGRLEASNYRWQLPASGVGS